MHSWLQPQPRVRTSACNRVSQPVTTKFKILVMLIIFFATSFRPGEATTPGPVIGNMNPTGLMGKASEIATLPSGLYTFQESHLTSQGIRRFKQELAWCKTGYRLHHGHPAPPKNDSVRTIGGRHTGTGVLTPYPCRPVEHHWTPEQYQSGRCHVSAVFMIFFA